ncbi:MAG TPA: DUF4129 domain-containing protein [Anaerolineales bacterium]|nr:DUF4129 domain-containing protein [Anaerolineales bacterium]
MRSFFQHKLWIILLATLALGALTVLAVSLDEISFGEAQRFRRAEATPIPPVSEGSLVDTWEAIPIWKHVVVWGLVAAMIVLVALLLSPEMRKRLFKLLIRFAFTVFAIYYFFTNYGETLFGFQSFEGVGEDASADIPPMPVFEPPQVSPVLSYLISFACALIWIAIMWGLYRGWKRYTAMNSRKPLDDIALIARSSLRDLSSGRDSSDVIINCYLRMSDVVADKRKLQREVAMTPQEFALRLERAGLPGDAVRRLTGLFEIVRYGDRKSAPKDVTEAVSCLNTILHYCGEPI